MNTLGGETMIGGCIDLVSSFKCYLVFYGAADGSRTRNPRNGSPMLYRLSYNGELVSRYSVRN